MCLIVKPVGEPDAGNPHVRFDERGWETGRRMSRYRAQPRLYRKHSKLRAKCRNIIENKGCYWKLRSPSGRSTDCDAMPWRENRQGRVKVASAGRLRRGRWSLAVGKPPGSVARACSTPTGSNIFSLFVRRFHPATAGLMILFPFGEPRGL